MTVGKFRYGWGWYTILFIAYITGLTFFDEPPLRLLWMAAFFLAYPAYIYLRQRQIAWGYFLMAALLAAYAGLMAIHPGLPWVFLVPVIFVGFVIAPIWRALRDSRGEGRSLSQQ